MVHPVGVECHGDAGGAETDDIDFEVFVFENVFNVCVEVRGFENVVLV